MPGVMPGVMETHYHPFPASNPLPRRSCQQQLCPQGYLGAGGSEALSSQ